MPKLKLEQSRKCQVCGSVFKAKTLDSLYCSPKCSKVAQRAKKHNKLVAERLEKLEIDEAHLSLYMTVKEASRVYKVCANTLYERIRAGKIEALRISERNIRISRLVMEKMFSVRPEDDERRPVRLYNMEPEACYTIGEICKKYKINDSSVWKHVRKYSIPLRYIGNFVYVPKEDIDKLYSRNQNNRRVYGK